MIELDGRSYVVDSPATNALNLLGYANQFMTDNEVKNKKGDIVQFKVSLASPIWLICIGIGYMATVIQKIMFAVAQAFNIGSCSDQQLLELAAVARMQRKTGSYTTVVCHVTADDGGDCVITTEMEAKATYNNTEYTFNPMYNITIEAGETAEVILICTVTGPVYLEAGVITEFTQEPENFGSMVSSASQPGEGMETITQLRSRLNKNEAVSPLHGAIQAIDALDGITKSRIFYNPNSSDSITIAGKTVPPRQAVMFIQGYSAKIAEEYYKHMSAQTISDATSHQQSYTMLNGQQFVVNYFAPEAVEMKIKVRVTKALSAERIDTIKNALVALSNQLSIGVNYTQAWLLDSLNVNMDFPEIVGCLISSDDGENYYDTTTFADNNIGLITEANIIVEVI